MKQWKIYDYPFAEEGSHPVLILSNSARAENADFAELNGLFCRSVRPHFQPKPFHFVLDQADGLDNPTAVRCDHHYVIRRAARSRFGVATTAALPQGARMLCVSAVMKILT